MKRILSVTFIAMAVMIMTVLSMVPHHHHHGLWCTTLSECFALHHHEDHGAPEIACGLGCGHDEPDSSGGHTSCVEDMRGISPKVKLLPSTNMQTISAAILVAMVYEAVAPVRECSRLRYYRPPVFYEDAATCGAHTLRAPPACFV